MENIYNDNRYEGFLEARFEGDVAMINQIEVWPTERECHIGQDLIQTLISSCGQQIREIRAVMLPSGISLEQLQCFYERNGFQRQGDTKTMVYTFNRELDLV